MPFYPSNRSPYNRKNRNQSQYSGANSLDTLPERRRNPRRIWVFALLILLGSFGLWFRFGTIQGVPVSVVSKFLLDGAARDAYFSRDLNGLHDRLSELGVEEDVKAFYRSRFGDEVELDWYIHQLLYERTGYIGKAYKLGANQKLILRTQADRRFPRWFDLAQKVGLVRDHYQQEGIIYLILSDGTSVLYEPFAEIYPVKTLRQIHRRQKKLDQSRSALPLSWQVASSLRQALANPSRHS